MKRIIGTMCLAVLVACSASSCKKNQDKVDSVQMGLEDIVLDETDSRAYLDLSNGRFKWNENDKIMVYNLAENYEESVAEVFTAAPGSEGLSTTTFSGPSVGERKDIGFFYFYPSYKATGVLGVDNRETFHVDRIQTYNERTSLDPTSMVMAIDVNAIEDAFTMKHIFGFLRMKITKATAAKVKNIVVKDNTFHLAGDMTIKLPEVDRDELNRLMNLCIGEDQTYMAQLKDYLDRLGYFTQAGEEDYAITLDCSKAYDGTGVEINGDQKMFLLALRPGALYQGFTVTINYMDSSIEPTVLNYDATINYCIKPGNVRTLTIGI